MFIRKNNNNNAKETFMNNLKNKFELSFSGINNQQNNQLKEIDLNKPSSCGIKKISRKSNNTTRANNSRKLNNFRKSPTPKLSVLSQQNPPINRNNLSVKNNSTRLCKPCTQQTETLKKKNRVLKRLLYMCIFTSIKTNHVKEKKSLVKNLINLGKSKNRQSKRELQ
tara:strand:- start:301 stop:801 length:501 start_codon:yes stop_codon:yes gene_type:complete